MRSLDAKPPLSTAGYDPSWSVKIVVRDENRLRPQRGVFFLGSTLCIIYVDQFLEFGGYLQ